MKKLIASTALALLGTLGFAGAVDAAPRKPVPLATACFYGSVKGPQCDAFPNAQNDWEGRVTPARWDPCSDNGTSTLLYITPCSRRSVSIAQWCTLHYDHHSRVFGKPCD